MKTKSEKDKLTLSDAAKLFGVSVRTIQYAVRTGKLEPVRHGLSRRAYYVTRASVNTLLKGGAQ